MSLKIDLSNQHILVTGGSRGIGAAISRTLIDAGAKVAIQYQQNKNAAEKLAKELGPAARLFQADLSKAMEIGSLYQSVMDYFGGKLHGIVHNAAIALSSAMEKEDPDWVDDWLYTMDVNVNAVALLSKKALATFTASGGGRIVTISSRAAFRGDTPDYMAYAASKGAIVSLTRSIARGYGKQGVKAFIVAPGFTRTQMAQQFIDQYGEAYATSDIALTRMTEPSDVAPTVAFLLSGLADHATGSTIDINAGSYVH
jgi:3-oxoacyl-[acyl-carrier protein] reductase